MPSAVSYEDQVRCGRRENITADVIILLMQTHNDPSSRVGPYSIPHELMIVTLATSGTQQTRSCAQTL